MHIHRVDPRELDDGSWEQIAAVTNSELAADAPTEVQVTPATERADAIYTFDDRPLDGYWLAKDGDRVVGWASLELSIYDNLDQGLVFCGVAPADRRQGIGTALLRAEVSATREAGRTKLLTFAFRETPAVDLLSDHGFTVGQRNAQRRLVADQIDYTAIQSLADEAAAAASDYGLLRISGPTPEEWLPRLATLSEGINDAPIDDLELEPDSITPERLRRGERSLAKRGQVVYRLVARHRQTGEWAAHTVLCVDRVRRGLGHQEDTTVLGPHRGHRLGLLLKASMLLWMREVEPDLTQIDTWNAETNAYMIAVNERLGCKVSNLSCVMQRHL